jgi:hypothetical protein
VLRLQLRVLSLESLVLQCTTLDGSRTLGVAIAHLLSLVAKLCLKVGDPGRLVLIRCLKLVALLLETIVLGLELAVLLVGLVKLLSQISNALLELIVLRFDRSLIMRERRK